MSHDEPHLSAPFEDFLRDPRDIQFSLEASQLYGAPGSTQPTQEPSPRDTTSVYPVRSGSKAA